MKRSIAALALLILAACAASTPAQRDPAEVMASASYKATAEGYDRLQEQMKNLRLSGFISKDQWDVEWTPLQFAVSRTAADVAADLVAWRTSGLKPAMYETHNEAFGSAVVRAESYVRKVSPRL